METENVVAVGFVIHELLGLGGGLILCYFGYRLLTKGRKIRQREVRGTWNSVKRFGKNAAAGTFAVLLGTIAIWITASNALAPKAFSTKNSVDIAVPPTTQMRMATPAENDRAGASQTPSGIVANGNAIVDQSPAPSPAPVPKLESGMQADRNALANNSQLPEVESKDPGRKTVEGERPNGGRKTLEKERQAAERKRSRLEGMYQSHLISADAYKKGEEQYKSEIERYRSAMNAVKRVAE